MKIKKSLTNHCRIYFILFAILITLGILFLKPRVGIADQGDFNRIMSVSGLSLLDTDSNNPNFIRFYNYIVTDYKITSIDNITDTFLGSSLAYLIVFITYTCKLIGQNTFKTEYLAIIYSILHISSFSVILKSLNIKDNVNFMIASLLTLFVFFDGNYLIWFNSLYGEPIMIVTLLLFITAVLSYVKYKYITKGTEKIMSKIVYVLLSAFLFLGSKLQVLPALPLILIFIAKIIYDNKRDLSRFSLINLCVLLFIVAAYPIGISKNSADLNRDTQYNSVFFGILNGSTTPKQDLISLGLNPDMASEAGKTAYLDANEYITYDPKSKLTDKEFYDKITNLKLVKFYLTHPIRLLNGMEYTTTKAFQTSTALGKYAQNYSKTPISEFHRFTLWSSFRENMLPRNLFFIASIYIIILVFSLYKYIKNKSNPEIKTKLYLLWTIALISIIEFPMPFVGNGQADTSKQLFLFNFIFDGLLLLVFSHALFAIKHVFRLNLRK